MKRIRFFNIIFQRVIMETDRKFSKASSRKRKMKIYGKPELSYDTYFHYIGWLCHYIYWVVMSLYWVVMPLYSVINSLYSVLMSLYSVLIRYLCLYIRCLFHYIRCFFFLSLSLSLTKPNTILNVFKYYFEKLFLIYFMKYI